MCGLIGFSKEGARPRNTPALAAIGISAKAKNYHLPSLAEMQSLDRNTPAAVQEGQGTVVNRLSILPLDR